MGEEFFHSREHVSLSEVVCEEYRTYQIYTLMDRAIPYLQDGLKPGQRRILYTLWKNQHKGLLKVSSVTGLVLTLHPHGPQSVEGTIVNLAQDYAFSNNYPLIDKKGYFGERMETQAAAGRYIECKLGKLGQWLLFDDMNQVEMIPNYDEKVEEPVALLPKLPLMLLNGAEGIGTGFSSIIPSFNHRDLIKAMIKTIESGKSGRIRPFFRYYGESPEFQTGGKIVFNMRFEEMDGKIFITEIPRNYDAARLYRFLTKFIEKDYIKDFIDSSVENEIRIELIFKRGGKPSLEEVREKMKCSTSMMPNYTLISDRGVRIFKNPVEIIDHFTRQRLDVVKRRYELLAIDYDKKIKLNSEIIKFIKNKEYAVATTQKSRADYVEYLKGKKYVHRDYLADMPIHRMVKEEVAKREMQTREYKEELSQCKKIVRSKKLVEKKLIEELGEVEERLNQWEEEIKRKKTNTKGKRRVRSRKT